MRFPKAIARLKATERGATYRLCYEHFPNSTVDEMLDRLSSMELLEWFAYLSMRDEAEKKARDAKK